MDASSLRSSLALGAIALPIAFALGCPVYSDDPYGYAGCYYATDCPLGYRCSFNGRCVAAPALDGGNHGDAPVSAAPPTEAARTDGSGALARANPDDPKVGETRSRDGRC